MKRPHAPSRWVGAGSALLIALATATTSRAASPTENGSLEYAVKAAYLSRLEPFVQWPAATTTSSSGAVVLCVVGADPFGGLLEQALRGQQTGRPVVARRLAKVDREADCQILYAAGSNAQSVAEALRAVRGKPVLTVTDSASDAGAGGIIRFVVKDNRVRFAIDDQAASQNGITLNSKLKSLALWVRPRS